MKSVLPTAALVYVVVGIFVSHWEAIRYLEWLPTRAALGMMLGWMYEVLWKGGLIFALWSALDYMLERYSLGRDLRMSRQEIRDESKETDGNPAVRVRIRRLQRQMRQRRGKRKISEATVVITNPSEYAVALRYVPEEMGAPVVVDKGRNLLARSIRREALWHGIPVVENPPLARALYRSVEVDQAIPAALYAAVAEILAFLYRSAQWKTRAAGASGAP